MKTEKTKVDIEAIKKLNEKKQKALEEKKIIKK